MEKAQVYLNSEGGCVFTACELAAMLERFKTVKIQVGALVASAATYLTSRFHTTVRGNTQGMIHKPFTHFQGNVDDLQAQLKLLNNITQDFMRTYAEKTGQSPQAIEALWSKGDYWMNAQEMKRQGFVDAIQGEIKAFTRADVSALSACGAPFIPDLQSLEPKADKMDSIKEELIALYGLEPSADQQAILAAAKRAQQAAQAYGQLKDPAREATCSAAAQELVDGAIKARKITADQRAAYLKLAQADWENTRLILEAMIAVPQLSKQLHPTAGCNTRGTQSNWSLEDYLRNDFKAYERMLEEQPEQAKHLEADYFSDPF